MQMILQPLFDALRLCKINRPQPVSELGQPLLNLFRMPDPYLPRRRKNQMNLIPQRAGLERFPFITVEPAPATTPAAIQGE